MRNVSASQINSDNFGSFNGMPSQVRLSHSTRALAARALAGEFGQEIKPTNYSFAPAEIEGLSDDMKAALAVKKIAEIAPLRIRTEELLVGSASLHEARLHTIPLTDFVSISHTTIGFDRILRIGYAGLQKEITERINRGDVDENGRELLKAMQICLDASRTWHDRYVSKLKELQSNTNSQEHQHYSDILEHLENVPENPPRNFREAVQALWMMWCFQRLCGNWSGIGRIDEMLGPFLSTDLAAGVITLDQARELLAHFWIKGCEWILGPDQPCGSGDAQFYQNIVLGGIDSEGNSVVNEVTYLVLDIVEELHISDFPISVRLNSDTPEKLLRKIAEVQRRGGGIVAVYNEGVILEALRHFGYPLSEARCFANDGCWEIIIPGKTAFSYIPFDMLKVLQEAIGLTKDCSPVPEVESFEQLYSLFIAKLRKQLGEFHIAADYAFDASRPAPLLSMFVEGCIEKGRGYWDLGPKYSVKAPHASGMPDAANSLQVIKALVFVEQRLTIEELVGVLRDDWCGHEMLQREIRSRFQLYGNGEPQADAMLQRVFNDYVAIAAEIPEREGVLRPAGISTFGREVSQFRDDRYATAFGCNKGDILASNLSPTPGTDFQGPTAVLQSYCSLDFTKLPNGGPLDIKLLPDTLKGETGINALVGILKSFVKLGGIFLHIDVVDTALLRKAQEEPEKYPNVCVRISGWSARFSTLDREWQNMIINRTEHILG